MKIILLSGGSGKRLWPLSNDARSKQFLRLLDSPEGVKESMIQRVVRQIRSSGLTNDIVVATCINQKDAVEVQLGNSIKVITEPCRRDTFPAILLACSYLESEGTSIDEPVVVMPCDSYVEDAYFCIIEKMVKAVNEDVADMLLMGIKPKYPSSKYGYIVTSNELKGDLLAVDYFKEKPDKETAAHLISEGALWNGGVFAFKLGYLMDIANRIKPKADFNILCNDYLNLPKISFDYAVVEKVKSIAVVPYAGVWKDLGTWNTLTEELKQNAYGNVHSENSDTSYIINELDIPVVSIGGKNLVVAASHDGILVSDLGKSECLKSIVDDIGSRPMYEERRWGEYKVINSVEFTDGFCALTKQLTLLPGKSISYQRHAHREEVWTFINGEGELVINGERKTVRRSDVITIPKGQLHALRATTPLTFIEVQQGTNLVEDDIERFPYEW